MKKLMLIVNPAAGRSGYKLNLPEALQTLDAKGLRTTLYFTARQGDATDFVVQDGADFDVVACVGGDGTLSEVMAGLMRLEKRPYLGYFPMGTSNDVATSLGLPTNDMVGAAQRIAGGVPHPYDVGGFNGKYFAYIAGFGAFTEVSYATPQDQKRALGHLAYVLQGMASLGNIQPVHARVEYDGGKIEGNFLYGSMSNSTSVGGIMRLPDGLVHLGDGMSELVLVKDPGTVADFAELVSAFLSGSYDSEKLLILHTRKARFHFDKPIPWTRDGEEGGAHTDVELCNYAAPIEFIF